MRFSDLLNVSRFFGGDKKSAPEGEWTNFPSPQALIAHSLTSPELAEFMQNGNKAYSGNAVTPQSSMKDAAVNRCTRILQGAIATMALDIKQRLPDGTRRDADDHQVSRLIKRRPNRWQTPSEWKSFMMGNLLLRGDGYSLKVFSRGRVIELLPLMASRMQPVQKSDLSIEYNYTKLDGSVTKFTQDEIFHLRGPSENGFSGMSVISYAVHSIGLSEAIKKQSSSTFKNGNTAKGLFRHPKTMGEAALKRFKESLEQFRTGGQNSGGDMIIEEDMKYDRISMSLADSQALGLAEFSAIDICMFFGIPPHMIGLTTKQTSWGSGLEQMSQGFVAYTLNDYMTLFQQTIDRDLLDDEGDYYARFNPASLVKGDLKTRYESYAKGRQWGWLSANDIRQMEDMNPIPDGDDYLVPLNMIAAGETKPDDGPTTKDNGDNEDDQNQNA